MQLAMLLPAGWLLLSSGCTGLLLPCRLCCGLWDPAGCFYIERALSSAVRFELDGLI
jgi:hypothetical protein